MESYREPVADIAKRMVRQWIDYARRPEVRGKVVFLEDYDLALAAELVQGVDLWINTPPPSVGSLRHERHEAAGQRWA
jgi:glucan phosphorylase